MLKDQLGREVFAFAHHCGREATGTRTTMTTVLVNCACSPQHVLRLTADGLVREELPSPRGPYVPRPPWWETPCDYPNASGRGCWRHDDGFSDDECLHVKRDIEFQDRMQARDEERRDEPDFDLGRFIERELCPDSEGRRVGTKRVRGFRKRG